MKITIYELLGMVKDGKAPKKIRYNYTLYEFNDKKGNYYEDENCSINWDYVSLYCLNDEVEILDDEEKGLPEKLPYYSLEKIQKAKNKDEWREERISLLEKRVEDLHIKMNELIDYLEKQKKENEDE